MGLKGKGRPCTGRPPNTTKFQNGHMDYTTSGNPIEAFRSAASESGVMVPASPVIGKLSACGTEDKPYSKNGRYVFFLDGVPAGGFQDMADGQAWQVWRYHSVQTMAPLEKSVYRRRIEQARREREADDARRYAEAATEATLIWNDGTPAPGDYPYFAMKQVKPFGVRICESVLNYLKWLIVPVMDANDQIQSLQFISPDGSKRFLSGGRLSGGRFLIGKISDPAGIVCIAEGFATAATIHEQTSYPCFVAFSATNLEHVALSIRARYPKSRITVCGDNDHETAAKSGRNPGIEAAKRAAALIGGKIIYPPAVPGVSDFNDYWTRQKGGVA